MVKLLKEKLMKRELTNIEFQCNKLAQDPIWYTKNVLNVSDIETYQVDIMNAIRDHNKVCVRSGHGIGKTAVASWIINWFFDTRPESKVIATASAWRQITRMLFPEVHKWRRTANLEKIGIYPDDWEGLGLMLKRVGYEEWFVTGEASDDPAKMEGFHAPHILYVIDEGKSVPDATYEAIEGALTTGDARVLTISTPPAEKVGYFYDVFAGKKVGYTKFHISSMDSKRVSKQWIEERRQEWGEDSTIFKNRVLGEFGDADEDTLIHLAWIEKCIDNDENRERWDKQGIIPFKPEDEVYIGCDVARFGEDRTVRVVRKGKKVLSISVTIKEDTMQTAGRIVNDFREYKAKRCNVDVIGMGAGVVDRLLEQKYDVVGVNVAEKSNDDEKYNNLRCEVWCMARDLFRSGDIIIPNDEELIAELSTIKYKYNSRGQIVVESKDDYKKRLGRSPDKADALILAYYISNNKAGLLDYYKSQAGQQPIQNEQSFYEIYRQSTHQPINN